MRPIMTFAALAALSSAVISTAATAPDTARPPPENGLITELVIERR